MTRFLLLFWILAWLFPAPFVWAGDSNFSFKVEFYTKDALEKVDWDKAKAEQFPLKKQLAAGQPAPETVLAYVRATSPLQAEYLLETVDKTQSYWWDLARAFLSRKDPKPSQSAAFLKKWAADPDKVDELVLGSNDGRFLPVVLELENSHPEAGGFYNSAENCPECALAKARLQIPAETRTRSEVLQDFLVTNDPLKAVADLHGLLGVKSFNGLDFSTLAKVARKTAQFRSYVLTREFLVQEEMSPVVPGEEDILLQLPYAGEPDLQIHNLRLLIFLRDPEASEFFARTLDEPDPVNRAWDQVVGLELQKQALALGQSRWVPPTGHLSPEAMGVFTRSPFTTFRRDLFAYFSLYLPDPDLVKGWVKAADQNLLEFSQNEASLLMAFGDKSVDPLFFRYLRHPTSAGFVAVNLKPEFAQVDGIFRKEVLSLLADPDVSIRSAALDYILRWPPLTDSGEQQKILEAFLSGKEPDEAGKAYQLVEKFAKPGHILQMEEKMNREPLWNQSFHVAELMGQSGDPHWIPTLGQWALENGQARVRENSTSALIDLTLKKRSEKGLEALAKIYGALPEGSGRDSLLATIKRVILEDPGSLSWLQTGLEKLALTGAQDLADRLK